MLNIIFLVIGIVLILTPFYIKISNYTECYKINIPRCGVIGLIALGLVVVLLGGSFKIIKTGYTGIKTTFGQVSPGVLNSGIHLKIPFAQSIKIINNKQQDTKFSDSKDDRIWGEAADKTAVYAKDILVSYKINPEKSAYIYANVSNYNKNLIPQSLVASAIKTAMVQLSPDEVTHRNKIEELSKKALENAIREKYGSDTIIILKVTIDEMDFEDSYNKAIADKQIARQSAEKQAIENQKEIDIAKAAQKKAEIEADTKKIKAQADADAAIIAANGEAEANRLISESVTDKIIENKKIEKWNGELPKVTSGNTLVSME